MSDSSVPIVAGSSSRPKETISGSSATEFVPRAIARIPLEVTSASEPIAIEFAPLAIALLPIATESVPLAEAAVEDTLGLTSKYSSLSLIVAMSLVLSPIPPLSVVFRLVIAVALLAMSVAREGKILN